MTGMTMDGTKNTATFLDPTVTCIKLKIYWNKQINKKKQLLQFKLLKLG